MLEFFRKYQRYFFIFITIVIVISFSFFGTYSAVSDSPFREQIAFTAVNGSVVTRQELDEMVHFIGTDANDKLLFGGAWGPNFLNDGVIKKDFLEAGLGLQLMQAYPELVKADLQARLEKERRYTPYTHPQARFIGLEGVWNYFAPEMKTAFQAMRLSHDPLQEESLQSRVALFLMERQFPAPLVKQVLRFQEGQYSWLKPDPNLEYLDLSLFGYHTVDDWFGPNFVRLVAEFIMNAAIIAEQKGYEVSKADALADLMRNSETSFQQNKRNPHLGVLSSSEYFSEQLRRLGMDHNQAAKLWGKVLLFRRFFQDLGNSVFVDPFTYDQLDSYALASVQGELFRLPKELRLNTYRALQKFEIYLDAIGKRSEEEKAKLKLPASFISAKELSQNYPQLVQKKYLLEIAQVDKRSFEGNVGVKETWDWELGAGWESIAKQFPELSLKKGTTSEERFAILNGLDDKTRTKIDDFARTKIVDTHPEWLEQALAEAPSTKKLVGLHEKGNQAFFNGLDNGQELMELLDAAPLAGQDTGSMKVAAKEAAKKLQMFTGDQKTYYRISVVERSDQPTILTFAEADKEGVLDKLLDGKLEPYYLSIREANAKQFQKEDKSWKSFADVKDQVADSYFESTLKAIKAVYLDVAKPEKAPTQMTGDLAAAWRLFPHVQKIREIIITDPAQANVWTRQLQKSEESKLVAADTAGVEQWKLERAAYETARSSPENVLDKNRVFEMAVDTLTEVNAPSNGDLNFFRIEKKGTKTQAEGFNSSVSKAKALLSFDAQQQLMKQLLVEMAEKKSISLDYQNQSLDAVSTEE